MPTKKPFQADEREVERYVSLARAAILLDADRSSVRRWLRAAGILPIVFGDGRNATIRYRLSDVENWLSNRPKID